jgi:hypothetical protein
MAKEVNDVVNHLRPKIPPMAQDLLAKSLRAGT